MVSIRSLTNFLCQKQYLVPILVFLIPLAVRSIPEVLMGPYIVGFDTMAFYVPNTLSWLHGGVNIWQYLAVAPLFYVILMSTVASGVPIVIALKVISPILLGFLGLSIYGYAKKGLKWSVAKSAFVAFLGTLYFVALRASWDQLREELGLVFLFVFLTFLINRKEKSWKYYAPISILTILVVLSHQLISVIMFGIILFTIVYELIHKDFRGSIALTMSSLPSAFFFVFINLMSVAPAGFQDYTVSAGSPLASWLGFTSYPSMLLSEGGFFLYCFLPLLPLVLISLKRQVHFHLRVWLVLSFILLLIPFAFVSPYRWILILTYPLAFLATDSLTWLGTIKWKRSLFTLKRLAALYIIVSTVILSFGYILATPQQPFGYFNPQQLNYYSYQIPTSLLQNTISVTDCQDTYNALQWFNDNTNTSALLLTHSVFYSWALLTIHSHQIRDYGFDDPVQAAALAAKGGNSVYLIWWISGQGWYNETSLPSPFQEVYHSGKIAIYNYNRVS